MKPHELELAVLEAVLTTEPHLVLTAAAETATAITVKLQHMMQDNELAASPTAEKRLFIAAKQLIISWKGHGNVDTDAAIQELTQAIHNIDFPFDNSGEVKTGSSKARTMAEILNMKMKDAQ